MQYLLVESQGLDSFLNFNVCVIVLVYLIEIRKPLEDEGPQFILNGPYPSHLVLRFPKE